MAAVRSRSARGPRRPAPGCRARSLASEAACQSLEMMQWRSASRSATGNRTGPRRPPAGLHRLDEPLARLGVPCAADASSRSIRPISAGSPSPSMNRIPASFIARSSLRSSEPENRLAASGSSGSTIDQRSATRPRPSRCGFERPLPQAEPFVEPLVHAVVASEALGHLQERFQGRQDVSASCPEDRAGHDVSRRPEPSQRRPRGGCRR